MNTHKDTVKEIVKRLTHRNLSVSNWESLDLISTVVSRVGKWSSQRTIAICSPDSHDFLCRAACCGWRRNEQPRKRYLFIIDVPKPTLQNIEFANKNQWVSLVTSGYRFDGVQLQLLHERFVEDSQVVIRCPKDMNWDRVSLGLVSWLSSHLVPTLVLTERPTPIPHWQLQTVIFDGLSVQASASYYRDLCNLYKARLYDMEWIFETMRLTKTIPTQDLLLIQMGHKYNRVEGRRPVAYLKAIVEGHLKFYVESQMKHSQAPLKALAAEEEIKSKVDALFQFVAHLAFSIKDGASFTEEEFHSFISQNGYTDVPPLFYRHVLLFHPQHPLQNINVDPPYVFSRTLHPFLAAAHICEAYGRAKLFSEIEDFTIDHRHRGDLSNCYVWVALYLDQVGRYGRNTDAHLLSFFRIFFRQSVTDFDLEGRFFIRSLEALDYRVPGTLLVEITQLLHKEIIRKIACPISEETTLVTPKKAGEHWFSILKHFPKMAPRLKYDKEIGEFLRRIPPLGSDAEPDAMTQASLEIIGELLSYLPPEEIRREALIIIVQGLPLPYLRSKWAVPCVSRALKANWALDLLCNRLLQHPTREYLQFVTTPKAFNHVFDALHRVRTELTELWTSPEQAFETTKLFLPGFFTAPPRIQFLFALLGKSPEADFTLCPKLWSLARSKNPDVPTRLVSFIETTADLSAGQKIAKDLIEDVYSSDRQLVRDVARLLMRKPAWRFHFSTWVVGRKINFAEPRFVHSEFFSSGRKIVDLYLRKDVLRRVATPSYVREYIKGYRTNKYPTDFVFFWKVARRQINTYQERQQFEFSEPSYDGPFISDFVNQLCPFLDEKSLQTLSLVSTTWAKGTAAHMLFLWAAPLQELSAITGFPLELAIPKKVARKKQSKLVQSLVVDTDFWLKFIRSPFALVLILVVFSVLLW